MTFLVSLPPPPHTHTHTLYEGFFPVVVYATIWYSVATYFWGANCQGLELLRELQLLLLCLAWIVELP